MCCASLVAARSISTTRRPIPEPGHGEVRLRIEACGLCGTDLRFYHAGPIFSGTAPGHEMMGSIDELGDGVVGFATGDRVVVEPLLSCGRCDYCRNGRDSICPELQVFGIHRDGGFAEFVTLPAKRLFRVPDGIDPHVAALAEPMAVAVHGLRLGSLQPGQRVLVLGAGTIGLMTAQAAAALGAGEVVLTARYPHQAELGRHLGADRVLTEDEASPGGLQKLGSEAPIDLVVETVGGTADTLRGAATAVRPGGAISVLGLFDGEITLNALPLFLKENSLVWSNCYGRTPDGADFAAAVDIVAKHRDALGPVVTHRVPLNEIEHAFELAGDKTAGVVKVSIHP